MTFTGSAFTMFNDTVSDPDTFAMANSFFKVTSEASSQRSFSSESAAVNAVTNAKAAVRLSSAWKMPRFPWHDKIKCYDVSNWQRSKLSWLPCTTSSLVLNMAGGFLSVPKIAKNHALNMCAKKHYHTDYTWRYSMVQLLQHVPTIPARTFFDLGPIPTHPQAHPWRPLARVKASPRTLPLRW